VPDTYTHRVLAIDPGHLTGWAALLVDPKNRLHLRTGTFPWDLTQLRGAELLSRYSPQTVVIERLPSMLDASMRAVLLITESTFSTEPGKHKLIHISPGEWKAVTKRIQEPEHDEDVGPSTQHERDAFRMGLFHLWQLEIRPVLTVRQKKRLRPKGTTIKGVKL
jgi:hypothetical protein